MTAPADDMLARITEYLGNGGLFNPELMDHNAVRDLVIGCRDEIERLREFEGFRGEQLAKIVELGVRAERAEDSAQRLANELLVAETKSARLRAELATERALFKEFQVKGIPMKYKRMEFNARLQSENSTLKERAERAEAERDAAIKERDALQSQVEELLVDRMILENRSKNNQLFDT